MGKDTIKRLAQEKALQVPTASLFLRQILDFGPDRMKSEDPEHEFHAINGVRYVLVAWDLQKRESRAKPPAKGKGKARWRGGHER